jgi:hypothetical protein
VGFWADRYLLAPGECTAVHWSVAGAVAVFLDGVPVTGQGTRQVCPANTTTYALRVVRPSGTAEYSVTIVVDSGSHPHVEFWADAYRVQLGACTSLHWRVTEARAVFLNHRGVPGEGTWQVCPAADTAYVLDVEFANGATATWRLTITVVPSGIPVIRFWAEQNTLSAGRCTVLHWEVENARAVYLDEAGVPGVSSRRVCPATTTTYTLRVVSSDGTSISKTVTISVVEAQDVVVRLWAERYTLPPGDCTQIHWSVQNVQEVYLAVDGEEEGVPGEGSRRVCPTDWQYYTVRAVAADGKRGEREIWVQGGTPTLGPDEVIAQAVVASVSWVSDLNPEVAGDQPGWNLALEGLNPLYQGSGNCCQTDMSLQVPQIYLDPRAGQPVDWPISAGQQIEFRAGCAGGVCTLESSPEFYLRLTSG